MKPKNKATRQAAQTVTPPKPRYNRVDGLRGGAIALMFFYHFCFDLNYFHWMSVDFYHQPFWLNLRLLVVTLFLTLVGVSLVLANPLGVRWRAALPRLARLLGCAALVSVGSYAVFPESMIFFGVLHFIFIASAIGLLLLRGYWLNLIVGSALILIGATFQHAVFNHPALQWLGMMTYKPITEDYVPLLPWMGVVMLGMFLARHPVSEAWLKASWQVPDVLRGLTWAGRHSLLLYMLHQPIFFGVLWVISG
ncbi:MAG: heparan-alpha-glucosaminide N-acetyltransferase [Gallionella sp.]